LLSILSALCKINALKFPEMAAPQLFGIIPTGCPIITNPTSSPSETSYTYNLPPRSFSHIVVFLLPGIALPPDTAAAVYLSAANTSASPSLNFKFLGGIGAGKESAIFKVGEPYRDTSTASVNGEVDMDAPEWSASLGENRDMILGISVESASSVAAQMSSLSASRTNLSSNEPSNALVIARPAPPNTLQLAQRIIKNAFNFLASFSGNVPVPGAGGAAGVEVVPLKAFEDWWRKFEGRVRSDPGFLERDND
jgi:protein Hikeshi